MRLQANGRLGFGQVIKALGGEDPLPTRGRTQVKKLIVLKIKDTLAADDRSF